MRKEGEGVSLGCIPLWTLLEAFCGKKGHTEVSKPYGEGSALCRDGDDLAERVKASLLIGEGAEGGLISLDF